MEEFILNKSMQSTKLVKINVMAVMIAISVVLFFISFPVLPLYPYLKVDFSDVPALIVAFIFSPLAGIVVLCMKCLVYYLVSGATDPVGVATNFISGTIFLTPIAYLYHRFKGVKSIVVGIIVGIIAMSVAMSLLNYLFILQTFNWTLGFGWEMNESVKRTAVLAGVLPFSLIKGAVVSALFIPLFVSLQVWIKQKQKALAG